MFLEKLYYFPIFLTHLCFNYALGVLFHTLVWEAQYHAKMVREAYI